MTSDDWTLLELDGVTTTGLLLGHLGEAVAYGARGDEPYVAVLGPSSVIRSVTPLGSGPVTSACSYLGSFDFVVGRSFPLLWSTDFEPNAPGAEHSFRIEDATTEGAVRLWTVCPGDEDVTVLTLREDGWLLQGHMVDGHTDPGRGLRVTGDVHDVELVVGADGNPSGLWLAGPVVGGDGTTAQVWSSAMHFRGWQPVELAVTLDGVTDLRECVAGHRDLRPVVLKHRHGDRPAPDVRLDPDHPVVLTAGRADLVAVQAETGPQLWSWVDGAWQVEDLPGGRLTAVVLTDPYDPDPPDDVSPADHRLYLVIDGQIWHRPHPIG